MVSDAMTITKTGKRMASVICRLNRETAMLEKVSTGNRGNAKAQCVHDTVGNAQQWTQAQQLHQCRVVFPQAFQGDMRGSVLANGGDSFRR